MNKIVKLAIFLGIVSAIAGGALAAVNNVTAPIIEKKKAAASQGALLEIFPDATFTEVEFKDESGIILAVHRAENKGYIFEMKNAGYNTGSPLEFMLGIDDNGNYVGYKVIVNEETNGLGSRVSDDEFKNTIVGKTIDDEIDTLSGATLSSRAIINGINAAKTVYGDLAGVEVEVKEPEVKVAQISLSEDYSSNNAVVENSEEVDGNTVYTVSAKGFEGVNVFEITVNGNGEIVKVANIEFKDTVGVGDIAIAEDYLASFNNATLDSTLDACAGATYTSKSIAAAVQAVLSGNGESEPLDEEENSSEESSEEEMPVANEGPKFVINDDYSGCNATVEGSEQTENGTVYTVSSYGFHGTSIFEVTVNENKEIVSVVCTEFNDTEGIGDSATTEDYLAKYVGATMESSIDVSAGATYTGKSVAAAVQAALEQ